MSSGIPGRGKQRKGQQAQQDVNNGPPMSGGPGMAMPNGSVTFATPIVNTPHAAPPPEYQRQAQFAVHLSQNASSLPSIQIPEGVTLTTEPASAFTRGYPGNHNQQAVNQMRQQQQQYQGGGYPQMQNTQGYNNQQARQGPAVMPVRQQMMTQPQMYSQYQMYQYPIQDPNMVGYPVQYAAAYAPQQMAYAPNNMQQQQQQMMGMGGPPVSTGAPMVAPNQMHSGVPMGTNTGGTPTYMGQGPAAVPPQMQTAPPPRPAPATQQPQPRQKLVLTIQDPTTMETINKEAIESAKKGVEERKEAEKNGREEEMNETDNAAQKVKVEMIDKLQQGMKSKDENIVNEQQPQTHQYTRTRTESSKANKCLLPPELQEQLMGRRSGASSDIVPSKESSPEPHTHSAPVSAAAAPVAEAAAPVEETAAPAAEEMPSQNEESVPEVNHKEEEDMDALVSSSSDKNTSGDSAICIQSTPPSPPAISIDASPAPEEDTPVPELEEPVSLDVDVEVESGTEPSTPAPVTPSISETNTLAEEDEDAEARAAAAAAEAEEDRKKRHEELYTQLETLEENKEEVNRDDGVYGRTFLYTVRDLEMEFKVTDCVLTKEQLQMLGVCRSQVSNDQKKGGGGTGFMPAWGRGVGGPKPRGQHPRAPYTGTRSEHLGGKKGGRSDHPRQPAIARPSIERNTQSTVNLHKAENAWKPEKPAKDDESEEAKKKQLLKEVRSLMNKITPTNKEALIKTFLSFNIPSASEQMLKDVIGIIFDKAVEEPKFCPLYSEICNEQVQKELKSSGSTSLFRNAILNRAQQTFYSKTFEDEIAEMRQKINEEPDAKKKTELEISLLEQKAKFRRRKFGNITFIGQLYLNSLLSTRIIQFCLHDLLITDQDEESVDCAVRLLETVGGRLDKEGANSEVTMGPIFTHLDQIQERVSNRIKFMIMNLIELRRNGWKQRKGADAGPKKLDEIAKDIKKEQMETQHARDQYDRKTSRGGNMDRMGGPGGQGGHPKKMIIQRGSLDGRGTPSSSQDRRSIAGRSAAVTSAGSGPKKDLSSLRKTVQQDTSRGNSLGGSGSKKAWASGATGGIDSRKNEMASALTSTAKFMQQRSSSQASIKDESETNDAGTGMNSEEEAERQEKMAKIEKDVAKRVGMVVGDYKTAEIELKEAVDDVLDLATNEKYGATGLTTVFKCFLEDAVGKSAKSLDSLLQYGHVLGLALSVQKDQKDDGKPAILQGLAQYCAKAVDEELWEEVPKVWTIVAEVLINAVMADTELFEGIRPQLAEFKDSFLAASKDTRRNYEMFVITLRKMAEMNKKREPDDHPTISSMMYEELNSVTASMDNAKLTAALEKEVLSFGEGSPPNLHELLQH